MYVSGFRSASRRPSTRTSATRPENFERNEPPCRRASSSATSQPTLWRVCSYSRPGLPRPATSRSSVEAGSPRRSKRTKGTACGAVLQEGRALPALPSEMTGRPARGSPATLGLPLDGSGRAGGVRLGGSLGGALGSLLAFRHLGALLELLFLGLGLDDLRRKRDVCEDDLLGIVEVRDALTGRQIGEAHRVADPEPADVELEVLGDVHRQALDAHVARHLREDAALGDAARLADQMDRHLRLDRLVEPHLVEVDVRDAAAERILLVRLEDRVVRGLLAVEDDVEDRVQPARAAERAPKVALLDAEGVRRLPASVEDTGDEPLPSQPPRFRRAAALAILDLQPDPFAGHSARKSSQS